MLSVRINILMFLLLLTGSCVKTDLVSKKTTANSWSDVEVSTSLDTMNIHPRENSFFREINFMTPSGFSSISSIQDGTTTMTSSAVHSMNMIHTEMHDTNDKSQDEHDHYDAYPDQMNDPNHTPPTSSLHPRKLSALSALIGTFYPLSCNANLTLLDCSINKTSMLTVPLLLSEPFTIPCGTCYTYDLGSNVTLPTGLRVMGKLFFPLNYYTNIYTPSVVVQGEMVIRSNASIISPDNQSVRFILTGTNDTFLNISTSEPNILACNNSLCNLGKKAFVIAGGKLDIQAFPPSCKSWTKIQGTVLQKPPVKNSSLFKSTVYTPAQCFMNPGGLVLLQDSFATYSGNWTGREGGFVFHNPINGTLTVANRKLTWQGPHIDLTRHISSSCFIPNQDYLLTARIRIDKADGTSNGIPTPCTINGTFCPRLTNRIGRLLSSDTYSTKYSLPSRYAGNYGQFVDFTGTIKWTANEIDPSNNTYWTLYIEGPEGGATITMDFFSIALPAASSYLNPLDTCQELLSNGNGEGNGFNPYPFYSYSSRANEMIRIVNENGNNFFRLTNRNNYDSSLAYNVDTRCFDLGVTYFASAKIRIQSDFPQSYYILLRMQKADGTMFDRTIVNCPPQSRFDGWVTCSGEFTVDTDLNRSLSAIWRLYLTNTRDGIYSVDYDELSISLLRGYVDKIVVDSVDTKCWGSGSDLHVTSSTFYNGDGTPIVPNGYIGKIMRVTDAGNGSQFIQISPPPTLPILSQMNSSIYAAEVALLSRNTIIEGFNNEAGGKGGYLQILHTPNVAHTIQGAQFVNMGRLGEYDRFALHILYSGSISGTSIAKNSIVGSNHRGIVIEGSSNMLIHDNVAVAVSGHAFYVGDQSQNNILERNLGSQTKTISSSITLYDENDYDAAAFFSRCPPNSFVSNVASGNMENGFYFMNKNSRSESLQKLGSAFLLTMGLFKNNVAHSNQYSGFALDGYEQSGNITLESSVSFKNRDRGLMLWNSKRVTITGGVIADNRCGLEARMSDNLTVSNIDIRGLSKSSRFITQPPFFWKLCPSTSSVSGYRINTHIKYASETIGAVVKNVVFADFDTSLDCPSSVAIEFNTLDDIKEPSDYISSFQNISIQDTRNYYINACPADAAGIKDILLTNKDGSIFKQSNSSGPYSIVSNVNSLTAFATNSCSVHPNMCVAVCGSTCLRAVEFSIEQSNTSNWALQIIKDNGDGVFDTVMDSQIVVGSKHVYDGNTSSMIDAMQHALSYRKFGVKLPPGSFRAQFLDDTGIVSWPRFVLQLWQSTPDCSNYAIPSNVALLEPPVDDCSNLIPNGSFEDGTTFPWYHRDGGYLRLLSGGGLNGSTALVSKRSWIYDGAGINFDIRCLRVSSGKFYEIKVWIRLLLKEVNVPCNPNSNSERDQCPSATFEILKFVNATTMESIAIPIYLNNRAKTLLPYKVDQFNLLHGVFKVDGTLSSAQRVYFYIEKFNRTFDLLLDDASISPFDVDDRCNSDLIRNGNFSLGSNIFWDSWGSPSLDLLTGSDYTAGNAIMAYGRSYDDWGLSQNLYCTKLVAGDRFAATVRYKLITNTSSTFQCNRASNNLADSCLQMQISTTTNGANSRLFVGETAATADVSGWNYATGIYIVDSKTAKADSNILYFNAVNTSLSIVYDTVSFTRIPSFCQNLVMNPSFDNGDTFFYYADERANMKISIQAPGFGGSGYATLLYDRSHSDRSLVQNLDSRCFYNNSVYTITGRFKLLNNTNYSSVSCDTNARVGNTQCPSVRLVGSNCNESTTTITLTFWSLWQWKSNDFNNFTADIIVSPSLATCKKMQLYLGHGVSSSLAVLIDDVQITTKSTPIPTPSPTSSPFQPQLLQQTKSPTIRKTLAPTTTAINCPPSANSLLTVASKMVMIQFATAGMLCTLVKVTAEVTSSNITAIVPLARSYDGFMWELAPGGYATSFLSSNIFQCYDKGCQFNLPTVGSNEFFQLRSYQYSLPEMDQYARMLERTSFGILQSDLKVISSLPVARNISSDSSKSLRMARWLQMQMIANATSHREFWRVRANPRLQGPSNVGIPNHPCETGARFRRFAFVRNDFFSGWTTSSIRVSSNTFPIVLRLNGSPRTIVRNITIQNNQYANYTFNSTRDYFLCDNPEARVGGRVYIMLEDGTCQSFLNPAVNFSGFENLPTYILNFPPVASGNSSIIESYITNGDDLILLQPLSDSRCASIPDVLEVSDPPVFGLMSDGSWLQFDPRLSLESNTVANPLPDGGGQAAIQSAKLTTCSNVPRTFLNEKQCSISYAPLACGTSSLAPDIFIKLDESTLLTLYNLTGRYVYGLKGLTVIDQLNNMIPHPCTPGLRSRWLLKDVALCNVTDLFDTTNATLSNLLRRSTDTNPYFRDITFPQSGVCDSLDTYPAIEFIVDNKCWSRTHPEYLSVYDMTYWTYNNTHPGNLFAANRNHSHPIKKWAENGRGILEYPSTHPYDPSFDHPITRWDESYRKFIYIGRFGDSLRLVDLPNELRQDSIFSYYGASSAVNGGGVLVCGSPGEVANDPFQEALFDVDTGIRNLPDNMGMNRKSVWTTLVMSAPDQFRQRVAWALSQLLVVVPSAVGGSDVRAEWFVNFYDIFVRNAFGNYRDILREVSYNALMAENLSYLGSKSASYVWENYRYVAFADENFAREIMQLFSIGIIKLNLDGTSKLDTQGNTILSYTNDHIMSFARAWTGFDLQPKRGNIESNSNRIDPMRIQAHWRDRFPKSDLNDGYLGDGYPLCVDLPRRMFLRKGATYRFLGSSSLPELMEDPIQLATDPTAKRVVLSTTSALRALLCNGDSNGNCRFSNIVSISSNLPCNGIECLIDTVRVVQMSNSSFYEYVPPACVQQSFFSGAVKLTTTSRYEKVICENPKLPSAGAACCSSGSTSSNRISLYDVERMTLASARARCISIGRDLCDYDTMIYNLSQPYKFTGYHWTTVPCVIMAKINPSGYVAIVHEPNNYLQKVLHVDNDTGNYFKAYWQQSTYPKASNLCDGICDVLGDSCLCGTSISTVPVYSVMPSSAQEALIRLRIGSPDPESFDAGTFFSFTDVATNITVYTKRKGIIEIDSIFSFIDSIGRKFTLKNAVEYVQIRSTSGFYSGFSFLNAPRFMSLLYSETTTRDARYETEATLDNYFYHDNTAPFLSIRLIQRFVSSNPSPRYVKAVASAFRSGSYRCEGYSYGNGLYGDLAATMAAVILDREARSVILDADPTTGFIREPLLRLISLMRSLEFAPTPSRPIIQLNNLEISIGQMAYEFPSVFSFLLPEFQPSGLIGDRGLVSPEAALLDMPKIINFLNGAFSMINYGLSACMGGFGPALSWSCYEGLYNTASGIMSFNVTTENPFNNFFETFEGPSLVGGFDSRWVGRNNGAFSSTTVIDPRASTNHVIQPKISSYGEVFSRVISPNQTVGTFVVKFRYYSPGTSRGGGCIGLYDTNFGSQRLFYCDWSNLGNMTSAGNWLTCQYQIPASTISFRIGLFDAGGSLGDAFFDDIQVVPGSGTSCTGISLQAWMPPGRVGYSAAIVDTLASLMTAGRLTAAHRDQIRLAFDKAGSANDGLRVAQQLILTTSEFHTASAIKTTGVNRSRYTFPPPSKKPYRAVVFIMFNGGADSFNVLTPYSCTKGKDLYREYLDVRQQVALSKLKLLEVPASNQVCESFGVHSTLKTIRQLYLDGNLAFFANTGVLNAPVNKTNYYKTPVQLFAHNSMQQETRRVDPFNRQANTGVLGRMLDVLVKKGHNVGSFSMDRNSVTVSGKPGVSSAPMVVSSGDGQTPFYASSTVRGLLPKLHEQNTVDSGYFSETWSNSLMQAINGNDLIAAALLNASTSVVFPNSYLGRQLRTVARLISTRNQRGVDTDTFYVEIGGFDTHGDVELFLANRFVEVDGAIAAFVSELKNMGVWNNVTVVQTSDFARTLAPNSGDGTDHAWGGNYWMLGGDVKGGQLLGTYPETLTDNGPLVLSRGRLIPTTPWDAVFQGVAGWLSITGTDLDYVCPNRKNFPSSSLFTAYDMFVSGVSDAPTIQRSVSPITMTTSRPSKKPITLTRKPSLRSKKPTQRPSKKPSLKPSSRRLSSKPSQKPSRRPTRKPSQKSSRRPTRKPSQKSSRRPTRRPSQKSSRRPTRRPSQKSSPRPTRKPSQKSSPRPTRKPSQKPSRRPTRKPSQKPSRRPTRKP